MAIKQHYVEENHEGKLYRVRDKDHGDGSPTIIWGAGLTYEAAHALKERVCGRELSRDARIEDEEKPMPTNPVDADGKRFAGAGDFDPRVGSMGRIIESVATGALIASGASSLVTAPKHPHPDISTMQAQVLAGLSGVTAEAQQRAATAEARQATIQEAEAALEVGEDVEGDIDALIDGDLGDLGVDP